MSRLWVSWKALNMDVLLLLIIIIIIIYSNIQGGQRIL